MTTLAQPNLALGLEEFLEAEGDSLRRPGMKDMAREALERATDLISPATVYNWFAVGAQDRETAQVGGVVFTLGRHADLLAPARTAFVAVVTIGPRLEERARELRGSSRALEAFMLDEAGVFAVGKMIGARCIWVDTVACVERMTLSGRLAKLFADEYLVQWPHLARPDGPHYHGSLL